MFVTLIELKLVSNFVLSKCSSTCRASIAPNLPCEESILPFALKYNGHVLWLEITIYFAAESTFDVKSPNSTKVALAESYWFSGVSEAP